MSGCTAGLPIVGGTATGTIGRCGFAASKRLLTTMATAGTTFSAPIDCRAYRHLRLQFQLVTFSDTPVGTFNFYGCEDVRAYERDIATALYGGSENAQWTKLTLDQTDGFDRVHGVVAGKFAYTSPSTDITVDGTAGFNGLVCIPDPPAIVRVAYVRTSGGGSATDLRILASMREA